jgi:hypothetical protein
MASLGWILLAGAFLVLIMVANNSWPFVWAKISRGIPQPGEGNPIVPNPTTTEQDNPFTVPPEDQPAGPPPGTIVPTPDSNQNQFTPGGVS